MSRTRLLKPEFFRDEDLAELPVFARLLFAGLWTIADREGRLEDRPKRIKVELLPYDDEDVNDLLSALDAAGFIRRYSIDGKRYIQIKNFVKHQHPHPNEPSSGLPKAPANTANGRATSDNVITASDIVITGTDIVSSDRVYTDPNSYTVSDTDTDKKPHVRRGGRLSASPTSVCVVFEYWQSRLDHPDAKLSEKRKRLIASRIKDGFSIEDLKLAIDGCRGSPFHQGENDRGKVYDSIELICRDVGHVEDFIRTAKESNGQAIKHRPRTESKNERRRRETAELCAALDAGELDTAIDRLSGTPRLRGQ